MSKLWVCYNCGELPRGEAFEAPEGKCPTCGETAPAVVERTPVHFDPPHPTTKNKGTGRRPCDDQFVTGPGRMATGDPACVTCPKCLAAIAARPAT